MHSIIIALAGACLALLAYVGVQLVSVLAARRLGQGLPGSPSLRLLRILKAFVESAREERVWIPRQVERRNSSALTERGPSKEGLEVAVTQIPGQLVSREKRMAARGQCTSPGPGSS